MADKKFFDQSTPRSLVKIDIVTKYFWAWATALKKPVANRGNKLAFLDLYAGPGSYILDGVKSTPLRVLETLLRDDELRNLVATRFNDAEPEHCRTLEAAIASLPLIDTLRYPPTVTNMSVSQEMVNHFLRSNPVPILLFLDPFGYKGLSIDLIWSVVRTWGSDCIFFFNYRRVNAGLPNHFLNEPIDALFSRPRADVLRERIRTLSVDEREQAVIEAITEALKEKGGDYVQGFRFRNDRGTRTSHFLIFVSKNPLGLKLMKSIMAKESSALGSEVPSFEYNPAGEKKAISAQAQLNLMLFEDAPDDIDRLADDLLTVFQGKTITMEQVFHQHNVGTNYIEVNYKTALLRLEAQGRIICGPPADVRPKREGKATLGKGVIITFPREDTQKGI